MRPVMAYHGATRDLAWRIGWIAFDGGFTRVVEQGDGHDDPLITPPPGAPGGPTSSGRAGSGTQSAVNLTTY